MKINVYIYKKSLKKKKMKGFEQKIKVSDDHYDEAVININEVENRLIDNAEHIIDIV